MKASPIYNRINVPGRKSDASFGARESFTQEIRVGTSSSNSHELVDISVARIPQDDGSVKFVLWVDGMRIKEGYLQGHDFELTRNDLGKIAAYDEKVRREREGM